MAPNTTITKTDIDSSSSNFLPIDLETFKLHARVDIDEEDDLIIQYIHAATKRIEALAHLTIYPQNIVQMASSFPKCKPITLLVNPVIEIDNITYVNEEGDSTIYTGYQIKQGDKGTYIYPAQGELYFPSTQKYNVLGLTIEYTAGYLTPSLIPSNIKQAILMYATDLYENRVNMTDVNVGVLPEGVRQLLPFALYFGS
jgi:uncharacterized phiE125 gp8 family phage protein